MEIFRHYIQAPLSELGNLARILIKSQMPIRFDGGMTLSVTASASKTDYIKKHTEIVRRKCAENHWHFSYECYKEEDK